MSTTTTDSQNMTQLEVSGRGCITQMRLMDAVRHNQGPVGLDDYLTLLASDGTEVMIRFEKANSDNEKLYIFNVQGRLASGEAFVGTYNFKTDIGSFDVMGS